MNPVPPRISKRIGAIEDPKVKVDDVGDASAPAANAVVSRNSLRVTMLRLSQFCDTGMCVGLFVLAEKIIRREADFRPPDSAKTPESGPKTRQGSCRVSGHEHFENTR